MIWSAIGASLEGIITATDNLFTSSENKAAIQKALNEGNADIVRALSQERRDSIAFALETAKSVNPFVAGARPVMMWCVTFLFSAFCIVALLSSIGVIAITNHTLFGGMFETISVLAFGLYGVRAIERRKKP